MTIFSLPVTFSAALSWRVSRISTWSSGRMKPPAALSAVMSMATARIPFGRTAARKPEPLASTTIGSKTGCPAASGTRTMAPVNWLIASGRADLTIKLPLDELFGHTAQPISLAAMTSPRLRLVLATSTSTVSSVTTGALAGSGAGLRPWLAKYAATPPAAMATPNTTRRAAFITLHFPNDALARCAVMAEFDQLNVKAWLMRRIQIALILGYAGRQT